TQVPVDGIRFVKCSSYEPTPQVIAMVPAKVIQQHRLIPLELRDKTLTVGMVDPTNSASRTELGRVLGTTELVIVAISQDDFNEMFVRLRIDSTRSRGSRPAAEAVGVNELTFALADQEREAKKTGAIGAEGVTMASRSVAHAGERGAPDVHIENDVNGPRVRFRVQGTLSEWDVAVPQAWAKSLIARFKILAGLDVTERRLPLDGRIGVRIGRRE